MDQISENISNPVTNRNRKRNFVLFHSGNVSIQTDDWFFLFFLASLSVIIPLYNSLYYLYCNWFVQKKIVIFKENIRWLSVWFQLIFRVSAAEKKKQHAVCHNKPFTKPGDSFHQCETLSFQKHHSRYNYTFFFLNIFFPSIRSA